MYWERMLNIFFTVRAVRSKNWETTAQQLLIMQFLHAAWSYSSLSWSFFPLDRWCRYCFETLIYFSVREIKLKSALKDPFLFIDYQCTCRMISSDLDSCIVEVWSYVRGALLLESTYAGVLVWNWAETPI